MLEISHESTVIEKLIMRSASRLKICLSSKRRNLPQEDPRTIIATHTKKSDHQKPGMTQRPAKVQSEVGIEFHIRDVNLHCSTWVAHIIDLFNLL